MCRSISLVVQLFLVFTSQKFSCSFPSTCSTSRVIRRIDCGHFSSNVRDDGGGIEERQPSKENSSNAVAGVVEGVTLKMAFDASSVWGVADLSEAKSERFTSPASLDLVHRLRRVSDCVLVGKGTVERDNCTLTVRRVPLTTERPYHPIRVVLDPALTLLKTSRKFEIFHDGLATWVYYSPSSVTIDTMNNITEEFQMERGKEKDSETIWRNNQVTLIAITELPQEDSSTSGKKRYISPKQIVHDLTKRGIRHIMVEGGPKTATNFLHEGVIDRAILIRASVKFQEPLRSNMSHASLEAAGLQMIHQQRDAYGDTVEYWTKSGFPWPCEEITAWP